MWVLSRVHGCGSCRHSCCFLMTRWPPRARLFPYTTLFRSEGIIATSACLGGEICQAILKSELKDARRRASQFKEIFGPDRKSTRLNSSHGYISYAVFCLNKKKDNPRVTSLAKSAPCSDAVT